MISTKIKKFIELVTTICDAREIETFAAEKKSE